MSVLLVNHVSEVSGAEMSLLGLVRGLPAEGFSPEVALPGQGPLAERLRAHGVPTHAVPLARLKRRAPLGSYVVASVRLGMGARLMSGLIRRRGLALVHANSATAAMAALRAARAARVPGLWHVRDLVPLGPIGAWLGRLATRVVATSRAVASLVEGWGTPPDRIAVIPNGVDLEAFRPDPAAGARLREELGLGRDAFIVASVGQIVPWKGHHVLLDAVARLRGRLPQVRVQCAIAGADLFHDHPDYEALLRARAAAPDLAGAVHFLGYRSDIAAVYNAADVFALASRREPFGRALVEAMACGKPVVAIAEGGPAEIVEDGVTGLLVRASDPEAFATAIERLLDPALAGRLAQAASAHVRREYPEARMVARVAHLYREVLAEAQVSAHRR